MPGASCYSGNPKTTKGKTIMKFNTKAVMAATVFAMGLSVAACDSAAENQAEDEAEAYEDVQDGKIEQAEAAGEITEDQADEAKEVVEDQADAMEDQADEMDATPE